MYNNNTAVVFTVASIWQFVKKLSNYSNVPVSPNLIFHLLCHHTLTGGWGIIKAQEENPCSNKDSITNGCSPQLVIGESLNSSQGQDQELISFNPLEYTYWLAGATGVGVLWAICWTAAAAVVIVVIHWFNEVENDEKKTQGKGTKVKPGKDEQQ